MAHRGPEAFEKAVAQNAEKIQVALERLRDLEEQASRTTVQREVLKFVLLWIVFNMVGLIFDVIRLSWNTAAGGLIYGFNALMLRKDYDESGQELENARNRRSRIWQARFNRFIPYVALATGPLPDILRWSIQLTIFATLLAPLFNEIAASLGSHTTFADVFHELKHLHFGAMMRKMHDVLFGS